MRVTWRITWHLLRELLGIPTEYPVGCLRNVRGESGRDYSQVPVRELSPTFGFPADDPVKTTLIGQLAATPQ
jgi:hypothetical protein